MPDIRIAMAAPTGKAAQRMKEALQNSLNDEKLQDLVTDDLKQLNPDYHSSLIGFREHASAAFSCQTTFTL